MGTGYTRNDTGNNIADGNVINASDLDGEFDAVESAFNSSTGHTHDGTSAEGGPITKLGPVQDLVVSASAVTPKTDNTLDLGSSSLEFKDGFFDGTVNADGLTVVGAADVTGDLDVDNININGNTISSTDTNGNIALTPNGTGEVDISKVDIDSGAIDGTTIGASSAAAITGTTITGTSFVTTGDMTFGDNDKAIFGAGSDLQIYHDGSNSYVRDAGTGNLRLTSDSEIHIAKHNNEFMIRAYADGAVELYYDDSEKLATTSTGVDVTGNATFDDNGKAIFGAGSDLQIYHDSNNSYVQDQGTGSLRLGSDSVVQIGKATAWGELMAQFTADGGCELRHDNAAKLNTTSTGVDVTGNINVGDNHIIGDDANDNLTISSSSDEFVILEGAKGILARRGASDTNAIRVGVEGDISFYADDGTTQALFFDASTQRLGLGTTSPNANRNLHLFDSTSGALRIEGTARGGYVEITDGTNTQYIGTPHSIAGSGNSTDLSFWTAGSNRMTIDGSGNVGIGTTSPSFPLDVVGETRFNLDGGGGQVIYRMENSGTASNDSVILRLAIDGTSADSIIQFGDADDSNVGQIEYDHNSNFMAFDVNATERMRIDSSGNVGIGTSSPAAALHIISGSDNANTLLLADTATDNTIVDGFVTSRHASSAEQPVLMIQGRSTGSANEVLIGGTHNNTTYNTATSVQFYTASSDTSTTPSERMRIDSSGNLLVGTTNITPAQSNTAGGLSYRPTAQLEVQGNATQAAFFGRTDDGQVLGFYSAGTREGSIDISGTTTTFNGGHLGRWSQATDGNRISGLVKGTVMTNLDQMAVWSHDEVLWTADDDLPDGVSVGDVKTAAFTEDNEQLNCMAVSSVEGDANVAGVFVKFDEDDEQFTADMNIAMTGDMVIRIAQGTTVARGDLLMSAGDGTAKPQGDDIVRSKTIAKVTSTNVSHTYDDGSYLVPCVLMAC